MVQYYPIKSDEPIDIPTDTDISIRTTREHIERLYQDRILDKSEYTAIMVIIDGAESRDRIKREYHDS